MKIPYYTGGPVCKSKASYTPNTYKSVHQSAIQVANTQVQVDSVATKELNDIIQMQRNHIRALERELSKVHHNKMKEIQREYII